MTDAGPELPGDSRVRLPVFAMLLGITVTDIGDENNGYIGSTVALTIQTAALASARATSSPDAIADSMPTSTPRVYSPAK